MSTMLSSQMLVRAKLADAKKALEETNAAQNPVGTAVLRAHLNSILTNPIIESADMYKTSHKDMYPDKMTSLQAYGEARTGSELLHIVPFGMQIIVNELNGLRIMQRHIDEAAVFFKQTFGTDSVFERVRPGWQHVVTEHHGSIPVVIRALPEGTVVQPGTPLFTVESIDEKVSWMANFVETRLSHFWYTTAVASVAFALRLALEIRCLKEGMSAAEACKHASAYGVCDFGLRGVECLEAGARGGMAALTSSASSDNTASMYEVNLHYPDALSLDYSLIGSSIPAAEHSTIMAHGKANEKDAYLQILDMFPTGPVSIVLDSYDYRTAVTLFCTELKEKICERYDNAILISAGASHAVVLRPDSGDMTDNVVWTLQQLYAAYGGVENHGYKVLHPSVRIIQGDGISLETYPALLDAVQSAGFSVTNIVVGSGGGLLQKINRDTICFAIKANHAIVDGKERNLQKETSGKVSKRGRLTVELEDGEFKTYQCGQGNPDRDLLSRVVYRPGDACRIECFSNIRARVNQAHLRLLELESKYTKTTEIGVNGEL